MQTKKGSVVLLVVVLVICAVLLGIVAYQKGFLGGLSSYSPVKAPSGKVNASDGVVENINKLEPGDDVDSIDRDLSQTKLDTIDQDVLGVKTEASSL